MESNTRKEIVNSADGVAANSIFHNQARPGSVMRRMRQEYMELGLNDIIKRCPEGFLRPLTESLKDVGSRYHANERELTMVADVLVENRNAYIQNDVKNPMTPDEAIAEVRKLLAQQEPETIH
jgi:hypothetical protein